jgi:phage terminase large subunit-like protein
LKSSEREGVEVAYQNNLPFFIEEEIYEYDSEAKKEGWRLGELHKEWNDILELKRICIKAPRDHLKTFFFSESYPARRMRFNPDDEIQIFSKTDKLAVRILDKIKKRIFKNPNLEYLGGKGADFWSKTEIRCSNGATIYAQGFWSAIRGGHPRLIIMDDVIDSQVVYSDEQNEKAKERLAGEVLPMAEPDTQIIMVGTLQREDDIYSAVDRKNWFVKSYDAILDEEKKITLFPEKWDWEKLMRRKEEISALKGEKWFLKEYRNFPVKLLGEIIKKDWLQWYDELPAGLRIYTGWDLSVGKELDKGDYTACITFGIDDKGNIFIIRVWRERIDFPTRLKKVVEFAGFDKSLKIRIESNTFQADSVKVLIDNTALPIEGVKTTENKIKKFSEILAPLFENRKVFLKRGDEMHQIFADELCSLPRGKYDDMCLIGNTKIATLFGDKEIRNIKKGEMIITPFGLRKVLEAKATGKKEIIEKIGLKGTGNHPIVDIKNKEFCPLDAFCIGDNIVSRLKLKEIILWQYQKLLFLMGKNTNSWAGKESIILVSQQQIKGGKILKDFMWQFGNFIIKKQFQRAILFTIKMGILLIITLAIWSIYQGSNILKSQKELILKKLKDIWQKLGYWLRNGIRVKRERNGIGNMQENNGVNQEKAKENVNYAEKNFGHIKIEEKKNYIVAEDVILKQTKNEIEKENLFEVYNLLIDKDRVYYANGILVGNCDALCIGLKDVMFRDYDLRTIGI